MLPPSRMTVHCSKLEQPRKKKRSSHAPCSVPRALKKAQFQAQDCFVFELPAVLPIAFRHVDSLTVASSGKKTAKHSTCNGRVAHVHRIGGGRACCRHTRRGAERGVFGANVSGFFCVVWGGCIETETHRRSGFWHIGRVPASRPRRATESADDMPFKKELLVKAEQKIGGKDAKKLNHDAAARLSSADAAACLLGGGGKSTDLVQRRTAGGLVCRIIDVDKRPMLFEVGQAGLLPTLPGLWKVPNALPSLFTPPEVARFMINGADLLLPGVRAADAAIADLQPGAPACVRIFGNDAAIAVGVLVSSGATIAAAIANPGATKGVALAVEHVVGDGLWRLAGRPLPNAGFTTNDSGAVSVVPLAGVDPVGMGTGTDPGGSCSGGGGDAESEATTLGGAPAADGAPVDIGDMTEDVNEDDEAGAIGMAVAEMDELMKRCFLHAAIHVEDAKLPLLPNAFYNGHMRPKRPAGTSLDVKLSSWKKLLPFLKAMEKDGLCTLAPPAKGSTEPTIKALHRSAAGFAHFVGWEETAELAEARAAGSDAGAGGGIAGGGGGGGPLKVAKVYRPSEAMKPLFAANGATDTKRFYEEAEVFALLEGHVKGRQPLTVVLAVAVAPGRWTRCCAMPCSRALRMATALCRPAWGPRSAAGNSFSGSSSGRVYRAAGSRSPSPVAASHRRWSSPLSRGVAITSPSSPICRTTRSTPTQPHVSSRCCVARLPTWRSRTSRAASRSEWWLCKGCVTAPSATGL